MQEKDRELALKYYAAAERYEKLGGDDNLKQALENYEKGITFSERLVRLTLRSYQRYKSEKQDPSKEDTAISKQLIKPKFMENRKWMPDDTATEEIVIKSEQDLIDVYTKTAKLLEKLGGDDNLAKAHERNKQAFEIEELLEETLQFLEEKSHAKRNPFALTGGFLHPPGGGFPY